MFKLGYFGPTVTRYVTLFVERSGSTYLATLLASHPHVNSRREEFAHLMQRGVDGAGQLAWARSFWTAPIFGPYKSYGFKTKLVDILDAAGFAQLLVDCNARVIQLQRRNLVKAAISTINAKRLHKVSGNWNLLSETDRQPAFEVDYEEFERLLRERVRWDQELENYASRLKLPRLQLFYEDLLRDESGFFGQVLAFIGVEPQPMRSKTLKNTSDNLREVILNFEELRKRYLRTPYQEMFDEVIA